MKTPLETALTLARRTVDAPLSILDVHERVAVARATLRAVPRSAVAAEDFELAVGEWFASMPRAHKLGLSPKAAA